jgi:hypothetical protein
MTLLLSVDRHTRSCCLYRESALGKELLMRRVPALGDVSAVEGESALEEAMLARGILGRTIGAGERIGAH